MSLSADGRYWWDGGAWHPVAPDGLSYWNGFDWVALRSAPPSPSAPRSRLKVAAGILVLLAAMGLVVGAFLPWATLSMGASSSTSSGTDGGDGWIFVAGAVLVALAARLPIAGRSAGGVAAWIVVLGLAAGALVGYEVHQASGLVNVSRPGSGRADVTYDPGLYVLAASVGAVVLGGLVVGIRRPRRSRRVESAPAPARSSIPASSTYAAFAPDEAAELG